MDKSTLDPDFTNGGAVADSRRIRELNKRYGLRLKATARGLVGLLGDGKARRLASRCSGRPTCARARAAHEKDRTGRHGGPNAKNKG